MWSSANWEEGIVLITCIYGNQYVTVLSYHHSFEDLLDAVPEHVEGATRPCPLVIISAGWLDHVEAQKLIENELVSLILE